ncbi:MAG TPA: sugar transferase [Acetobacteraceae bacterium]|nr:sugar transferase [Acetobacteraceae bacterium]
MYERWGKRALDVACAMFLLLFLAPVVAATALAVRLALGRPVLFRQVRLGRGGVPFVLMKFRSMREGEAPDADRLGRFGRVLRASALDELPQLWHVLRGEMSLVGPRPLLPDDVAHYTPRQRSRLRVRPGMTGLAQTEGRNAVPWERRLEFDARYAERVTLRGDLAILLRTPALLLRGRGVSAPGEATMPRFKAAPAEAQGPCHKSEVELRQENGLIERQFRRDPC